MKNFSFKKLGFGLAAVALVAGSAYAAITLRKAPSTTETTVWTVPTSAITANQVVTFVAFDANGDSHQLKNTKDLVNNCAAFDANASDVEFTAVEDADYPGQIYFKGADDAKLKNTGMVVANEVKPEVLWTSTYTSAFDQKLSNTADGVTKYLYYDSEQHHFQITAESEVAVCAYVKAAVKNATISDDAKAYSVLHKTRMPGKYVNSNVTYLRYGEGDDNDGGDFKPTITVKTAEANQSVRVQYLISASDAEPTAAEWKAATQTATDTKSADIAVEDLVNNGTITYNIAFYVHARTVVITKDTKGNEFELSYTNETVKEYIVEHLDDPTIDPATEITVDKDGYAKVTATTTTGANISFYQMDATPVKKSENQTTTTSLDVAASQNGTASMLACAATTDGIFATKDVTATITVHPNKTAEEIAAMFGTFIAVSDNSESEDIAITDDEITFGFTSPAGDYTIDSKTTTFDVDINGVTCTATSLGNGKATVTVPAGITKSTPVTLTVKAGTFHAVSGLNDYDQPAPDKTAGFNSYVGQTFAIDHAFNYISNEQDPEFTFAIYNGDKDGYNEDPTLATSPVYSTLAAGKEAIVTNSDNVELKSLGYNYTVASLGNGQFKVNLHPNASDPKLPNGDYMVKFANNTLLDEYPAVLDQTHTNKTNVTAYINIKEKVNFTYAISKDGTTALTQKNFCEKEPIYLIVYTKENVSGNAVDFQAKKDVKVMVGSYEATIPAGTYQSGKAIKLADNYGDLVGNADAHPTLTGEDLTVTVADNTFYANNNYNQATGTENEIATTWYQHVTYATTDDKVYFDAAAGTTTFQMTATSSDGTDRPSLCEMAEKTIKINGKDEKVKVDATGLVTITWSNKLEAGEYTLTFGEGSFTKETPALCKSNEISKNLVSGTVTFAIADQTITSKDKTWTIADADVTAKIAYADGTSQEVTATIANSLSHGIWDNVKANTKYGTETNGAVTLSKAFAVGVYDLKVAGSAYKAFETTAGEIPFKLTVTPYVTYAVADDVIAIERGVKNQKGKFIMTVSPATNSPLTPAADIVPSFAKTGLIAPSFNDGGSKCYLKYVDDDHQDQIADADINAIDAANGKYEVTFHFSQYALDVNNYLLNIPVDGVSATVGSGVYANNNESDLYVHFQVFKAVNQWSIAPDMNIDENTATTTTKIVALDDENCDRSAELDQQTVKYSIYDGDEVVAGKENLDATIGADGTITVNTEGLKKDKTYTLKVAKEQLTIDASTNTDMEAKINVIETATFVKESKVEVDPLQTTITIPYSAIYTNDGLSITSVNKDNTVLHDSPNSTWHDGAWDINFDNDAKEMTITFNAHYTWDAVNDGVAEFNKFHYNATDGIHTRNIFTFWPGGVKVGNTVNKDLISIQLVPVVNFYDEFTADGVTTTTTAAESDAYACADVENVRYNRTFKSTSAVPFVAPFDVEVSQVPSDKLTLIKLNAISGETKSTDNPLTLHYITVKSGKVYANKPYICKAAAAGNLSLDLTEVNYLTATPTVKEVTTTTEWFDFTTVNASTVITDCYAMTGGTMKHYGSTIIKPWRWYMETSVYDTEYVRVLIDGVEVEGDEATGIINATMASEDETIYNVAGQRLNTAKKNAVNIINGKKVIVK